MRAASSNGNPISQNCPNFAQSDKQTCGSMLPRLPKRFYCILRNRMDTPCALLDRTKFSQTLDLVALEIPAKITSKFLTPLKECANDFSHQLILSV